MLLSVSHARREWPVEAQEYEVVKELGKGAHATVGPPHTAAGLRCRKWTAGTEVSGMQRLCILPVYIIQGPIIAWLASRCSQQPFLESRVHLARQPRSAAGTPVAPSTARQLLSSAYGGYHCCSYRYIMLTARLLMHTWLSRRLTWTVIATGTW